LSNQVSLLLIERLSRHVLQIANGRRLWSIGRSASKTELLQGSDFWFRRCVCDPRNQPNGGQSQIGRGTLRIEQPCRGFL